MNSIFFLVLRRIRLPLIVVIGAFALCVFGLAMTPGVDAAGNPTPPMSLFHAFYVMTFTAATVGFGELPVPFSDAQRLWVTFSIYVVVFAWSYALLNLIGLLQDPAFQNSVRTSRFARRVGRLRQAFYIVCGGGETGTLVAHGLDRLGFRIVILERDPQRLQALQLEEFAVDPVMTAADAAEPSTLQRAGLSSPYCKGVIALTEEDETNVTIAVAVRLLAPRLPVLARIRETGGGISLSSFGAHLVINPFERFASHLASAVATPERHHLRELLTGLAGEPVPERHSPPKGHWIVCGYGRFGHAVTSRLRRADMSVTIVDQKHYDEGTVTVEGSGTDPEELREAGIAHAAGIVAGNNRDIKNLAIAVTARELKPDIFVVTRQNREVNAPLFEAFTDDLCMVPSNIVAAEFLSVITTPLLARFLEKLDGNDEDWCATLTARLEATTPGRIPDNWSLPLNRRRAEAVHTVLAGGTPVTLGDLLIDPTDRTVRLRTVPLLIQRRGRSLLLPDDDTALQINDDILFAGSRTARRRMTLTATNPTILDYVRTGFEGNEGALWRWVRQRRAKRLRASDRRAG